MTGLIVEMYKKMRYFSTIPSTTDDTTTTTIPTITMVWKID